MERTARAYGARSLSFLRALSLPSSPAVSRHFPWFPAVSRQFRRSDARDDSQISSPASHDTPLSPSVSLSRARVASLAAALCGFTLRVPRFPVISRRFLRFPVISRGFRGRDESPTMEPATLHTPLPPPSSSLCSLCSLCLIPPASRPTACRRYPAREGWRARAVGATVMGFTRVQATGRRMEGLSLW